MKTITNSSVCPCLLQDESGVARFGEVFCDMYLPDRRYPHIQPQFTGPRYVALQQLQRLEVEFGLKLQSGYEAEVTLMNKGKKLLQLYLSENGKYYFGGTN